MGRSADYSKQSCAIAGSLNIIGEPWTLLIIRDAFMGIARFEQWQERLGLARNVLAARLKHLVAHGVFEPKLYCERPKRYEYVLTDKGRDLKPILLNMMDWGRQYVYDGETPGFEFVHNGQGVQSITRCMVCEETVDTADLQVVTHDGARTLADIYKEKTEV